MRARSMRGVHVDFARFMNEEGDAIALGNASLNARGDRIDAKGNVVESRANISAAYHRNVERSVKQVSVKAIEDEFVTPAAAMAAMTAQAKAMQAAQAAAAPEARVAPTHAAPKGRKITDSE